jgi:soluble lytic murein transglycosylase
VKTCWIAAALLALAAACGAGAQACSSSLPPPRNELGPQPFGVQTPLSLPITDLPDAMRDPAPAAQLSLPGFDFSTFAPLLSTPGLEKAAQSCAIEDYKSCAAAVQAHVASRSFDALEEPRWHLQLGSLLEKAGDLAAARDAYARATVSAWPLFDYAKLGLARCLVGLGQFDEARRELAHVPPSSAAFATATGLGAELACRTGATGVCLQQAQSFANQSRRPPGWAAQSFRIAEMLATLLGQPRQHPEAIQHQTQALEFVRALIRLSPAAADRFDAGKLEQQLLLALPPAIRAEHGQVGAAERLARAEARHDAGQHEEALELANALASELGDTAHGPIACNTRLLQGKALADLKQRAAAIERFSSVVQHCKDDDLRAWALYMGGRAAFQNARYPEAERLFSQLEREAPRHRLADDARLYRAHTQREMGVDARFTELLESMPGDYPDGDMTLDGVFLLALRRMEKNDWSGASITLERAVRLAGSRDVQRGPEQSGRERYFQARAKIETGQIEQGLDQYETLIGELPLSYYMLHAYTRLSERDPARGRLALERALARANDSAFLIRERPEFSEPGFLRALELFRQGDVDAARRELEFLNLLRADDSSLLWGVSLLYARAGSARHSHALPRWQLYDWLERWPAGTWRQAWELAYPRPHIQAVTSESKRQGIEPELVYAIMREESAFDPAAVSPANAYGLMQIISPTARRYGKEVGVPYDRRALTTPVVSIAIGSRVLASYMEHFPEDPLLAIPGYNAGPGRPKRWAKDWPSVDFDVWVELIPYRETRRYTKRVLSSRAAYGFLYYQTGDRDPLRLPLKLSARAADG